jgi:hypothetical protein
MNYLGDMLGVGKFGLPDLAGLEKIVSRQASLRPRGEHPRPELCGAPPFVLLLRHGATHPCVKLAP